MPKRRRLFTHIKQRTRPINVKNENMNEYENKMAIREMSTARGRLQGALMDVLDPAGEESDVSSEPSPVKRSRHNQRGFYSDDERRMSRQQSYVLKLFDRSVDLSQFSEDSPLYPICRAWIANQPKADYSQFEKIYEEPEPNENSVELPGPDGPPISRIPELLPAQKAVNKDNINLDYPDGPLPSRAQLLSWHAGRWAAVRAAWLDQANVAEERYEATQHLLNKINVNNM